MMSSSGRNTIRMWHLQLVGAETVTDHGNNSLSQQPVQQTPKTMQQSCQLEAAPSICRRVVTYLRMWSFHALTAGRLSTKLPAPAAGRSAR